MVDEHLDRVTWVPEHLGQSLEARHVPVVVCAEHVDEPIQPLRELAPDVGGVGREVAGNAVRANEHAVLVVAVRARAGPDRAVLFVRVEERDRLGDLDLDLALLLPGVEVDAEALERLLDALEHGRDGVARQRRELLDVLPLIAVLGRVAPFPHGVDGLAEPVRLGARVVVVVLALDLVPCEARAAARPSRRTPRSVPSRR